MESIQHLIDTNILIYHFADEIPGKEQDKIKSIFKKSFNLSVVAKIEFLGWKKHTEKGFKKAEDFLHKSKVIYIDKEIASKTIEIRKNHSMKLPDALIAATAICGGYTLVTRNEDDFKNLDLKIYNPFKETQKEKEEKATGRET
jgi:predicted nucleic acid-binding protein